MCSDMIYEKLFASNFIPIFQIKVRVNNILQKVANVILTFCIVFLAANRLPLKCLRKESQLDGIFQQSILSIIHCWFI